MKTEQAGPLMERMMEMAHERISRVAQLSYHYRAHRWPHRNRLNLAEDFIDMGKIAIVAGVDLFDGISPDYVFDILAKADWAREENWSDERVLYRGFLGQEFAEFRARMRDEKK